VRNDAVKKKILTVIREAKRPLDINHTAKQLNLSWWPTYRLITEIIIETLKSDPGGASELHACKEFSLCMRQSTALLQYCCRVD